MVSVSSLALLGHRSIKYDIVPGGIPQLAFEDIAGACAGLNRLSYLLVRAKYVEDPTVINEIISLVATQTGKTTESARKVIKAALYEIISDNICPVCNGTGATVYRKCGKCNKSGSKEPTIREMAKRAEMPYPTFYKYWKEYYKTVVELFHSEIQRASSHIKKQLPY